ncbi:MAG: hypothetical protein Q9170_007090 [Blastenia crenularia]
MDLHWIPPSSRSAIQDDRAYTVSPSPARSPDKRHTSTARSLDPLLSQISPSLALEALEAPSTANRLSQYGLYRSRADASPSERALAIRAASAGKLLEEWHSEIQQWQWPSSYNGFEPPGQRTQAHEPDEISKDVLDTKVPRESEDANAIAPEQADFLPRQTALNYQRRIDDIRDALSALDFDELKMYVRDAHLTCPSRRPSSNGFGNYSVESSSYTHLDDFTAIVTTIIMQTLPVIFRLEILLGTWEVRLAVMRAIPGYISAMDQTQQEMLTAWDALGHSDEEKDSDPVTRPMILGLKARIESQIGDLGQQLDYMLDTLEGHQDTIPELWIDKMEQLEADFGNWVVEAEKLAINRELREERASWDEHKASEEEHSSQTTRALSLGLKDEFQTAFDGDDSLNDPTMGVMDDQAFDGSSSITNLKSEQDAILLHNSKSHARDNESSPASHKPLPLTIHHRRDHSNAYSDFSSESSYPGSATSDYFSNLSSPEIQDASKTEYFGVGSPVEVTTPGVPRRESKECDETVSRQSSQRTERGERPLSAIASPARSRASTVIPGPTIEEDGDQAAATLQSDRRTLPSIAAEALCQDDEIGIALQDQGPTPPIPAKSRHRFEDFTDLSPGNTPVKVIRRRTVGAADLPATPQAQAGRTPMASPTKSTDDELAARINSILTDIPANIRLARSSDARPDEFAQSSATRNAKPTRKSLAPRLIMRSQTAVSSSPAMTLTPADQKTTPSQNGEPGIKLYHLHQSGRQAPIKLFVRLVGENGERVMVRIGGGWADLAEYLKEYAIHHGPRAVSDGRFDIQGLPNSQSSSPVTTPGSLSNTRSPTSRPGSSYIESSTSETTFANRRYSTGIPGLPITPSVPSEYSHDTRPTSRDSNASSRRSWVGEDSPSLGLAGPKSRKAVVSPNKQAWVDTMVEKARTGSSEKKKGTRNGFGDLGIMGSTKRLFMKREKEVQ